MAAPCRAPPLPASKPPNLPLPTRRVGRTARAGRSGRSVTIVTQYDVEMFQKIEHLTGVKMEQFPAEREEVLLLLEQVGLTCSEGRCGGLTSARWQALPLALSQ